MAMSGLQHYPWILYLINDMEVNVIFLGLKVFISDNFRMFSCSENAQVTYVNN